MPIEVSSEPLTTSDIVLALSNGILLLPVYDNGDSMLFRSLYGRYRWEREAAISDPERFSKDARFDETALACVGEEPIVYHSDR